MRSLLPCLCLWIWSPPFSQSALDIKTVIAPFSFTETSFSNHPNSNLTNLGRNPTSSNPLNFGKCVKGGPAIGFWSIYQHCSHFWLGCRCPMYWWMTELTGQCHDWTLWEVLVAITAMSMMMMIMLVGATTTTITTIMASQSRSMRRATIWRKLHN